MNGHTSDKLTQIAHGLVLDEVLKDKLNSSQLQNSELNISPPISQQSHLIDETFNCIVKDLDKHEHDDDLYKLREARMDALKKRRNKIKGYGTMGYGDYKEVTEDQFAQLLGKSINLVCHFFSPEFHRCSIVDKHFEKICVNHIESKFVKLDAHKAPFFSSMLKIRMLPTIVYFGDGKLKHKSIGFSDFGGTDQFATKNILKVLLKHHIIERIREDDTDDLSSESDLDD